MRNCKQCGPEMCDEHFLETLDDELNLNDTEELLMEALGPENRVRFKAMTPTNRKWIAAQAWSDGMVEFTGRVGVR